ncbi:MAG: transposase [Rhodothermales bacterium]
MGVSHWVGDGYYAKRKVFDALEEADAYFVTRLRGDATLRYLYSGPNKSGPGAPKQYDGKINWHDPSQLTERFDEAGSLEDQPHVRVLTTLANSPHLKRTLRVVLLLDERNGRSVVLCSTDLEQAAEEIVRYYRLRYQIEFVIRDAKQHTGLGHCQARSQEKLDFHMNMSLAGVNLLRYVAARSQCTLTDYCRLAYNRVIVLRLLAQLGLGAESALIDPRLSPVLELGRMAA